MEVSEFPILVGDFIKCHNEEDCKEALFELSRNGYGAVVTDVSYTLIRITSVPEDAKEGKE